MGGIFKLNQSYDTKVSDTIEGVVNFWNVVNEDENYSSNSSKSRVKLTAGVKNLSETVLGKELSSEELSDAHDGLFDAKHLLKVVEK